MVHQLTPALARIGTCALLCFAVACGSEAPEGASGSGAPNSALIPGHLAAPNHPATEGGAPEAEETVGSIALSLELGDKQLDSMNYAIVGSGFSTSGRLDVSHSRQVSGVIGGIPFGTNYALTMNGKGVGSAPLDCAGSASFDLKDVGPLPVNIQITCKEPAVVEPPTAPTPAPVPPLAVFALACALGALGVAAQRRAARS
jgi:hypothetical protein